MKLSEYRNSSSWKGAIELGPKLMGLAEELPASEENGLSLQLRTLMIDLPATIAADLIHDGSNVRLMPVLKLLAVLELIDEVYPALDTAGIRGEVDTLAESLMSNADFKVTPPSAPAPKPAPPATPEATPVLPAEEAAHEATAKPEAPAAPAPAPAAAPVHTPVTVVPVAAQPASEETHVHPDSV